MRYACIVQPNMAKENFGPCSCDLTGLVSVQECEMHIQGQMPKEMAFLTLALVHEFAHLIFFCAATCACVAYEQPLKTKLKSMAFYTSELLNTSV